MPVTVRFALFQCIIVGGFAAGYIFRSAVAPRVRKLVLFNLVCLEPLIILNSTWGMKIAPSLAVLPLTGLAIVLSGFLLGRITAPLLYEDRVRQASFTISSSLSNQGFTMGAFICYMLIGPRGLALSIIFILYFTFYAFGFLFSYASIVRYDHPVTWRFLVSHIVRLQNMPLFATAAGLILTAAGVRRPVGHLPVDSIIYTAVCIYFITLGAQFQVRHIETYIRPSLLLALIRFVLIPGGVFCFFFLFRFDLERDIQQVIIIQSMMPAAVFSVVACSLYDLDTKMSSALFLINTVFFLVFVLPLLVFGFEFLSSLL